jgi:hypothetical protein
MVLLTWAAVEGEPEDLMAMAAVEVTVLLVP